MTKNKFDLIVFIGRMSPMTLAHNRCINIAMGMADKVVVLIGSSGEPRTLKNPFTYEERKNWVKTVVGQTNNDVFIAPIYDYPYNDNKWVAGVQKAVAEISKEIENPKIGIIGYYKDDGSFWLTDLFPKWSNINVKPVGDDHGFLISATDVRNAFYEETAKYGLIDDADKGVDVSNHIKLNVFEDIVNMFENNMDFNILKEEHQMLPAYNKQWGFGPFVTGDSVVIQNGHVLLVKRKDAPGKGLWALPGGFINPKERIKDGIIRELHEETMLKVPVEVLKRNIKHIHVFDNPDRDVRGRVITHAAFIDLGNFQKLPHVKGADDADKAQWVPFNELKRDMFFADHYHIIDFFINMA